MQEQTTVALLGFEAHCTGRSELAANTPVRLDLRPWQRFGAKWIPVRVKKTRQNKILELRF